MSQWFRFYESALDDPKVQCLSGDLFKGWVNLLCLAKRHDGALPPHKGIAFALRKTAAETTKLLDALVSCGLLDHDETGISPHNWNGRQYKSDVSTERVKRFRGRFTGRSGNGGETVAETPSESETDTETETEAEYGNTDLVERGGANAPRANEGAKNGRGTRLPDDWQPSADERGFASDLGMDPDATASSFRDYWVAVAGAKGRKADWPATWRNWCRRDAERRQPSGALGPLGQGKARRFQPPRGNDAFYEQLADIARRADD